MRIIKKSSYQQVKKNLDELAQLLQFSALICVLRRKLKCYKNDTYVFQDRFNKIYRPLRARYQSIIDENNRICSLNIGLTFSLDFFINDSTVELYGIVKIVLSQKRTFIVFFFF